MLKNLYMEKLGKNAKNAAHDLSNVSYQKRNAVLKQFNIYLKKFSKLILKENQKDINRSCSLFSII